MVSTAYWVVRIAVWCGMAKGDSARTGKCKCTDVCAVLDRDDAKVWSRGGLLSVSAPNFTSKALHFCFVQAGAMPTKAFGEHLFQTILCSFSGDRRLSHSSPDGRFSVLREPDPPVPGQSVLLRSAAVVVPKRRWAWARCSNQPATQGLMGCCVKER